MQDNINTTIITGLLIPIIPILAGYLIALLKKKTSELETKINNENTNHYLAIAEDAIQTTVNALSQTTVEALKKSGSFDDATQKEILEKAKLIAVDTMGQASLNVLQDLYGDVDQWLENKIENYIKKNK